MSPTCTLTTKSSVHQNRKSKSKHLKRESTTTKRMENGENVYVELDTKCSCPQRNNNADASIQFARRYLECQASMPVGILRSFINLVLPHSAMTKVSIFDSNDRLLNDSDRLQEISSSRQISLRFTLLNTVTSLGHCSCCSPSYPSESRSSCLPTVIRRETLDATLSTCPFVSTPPLSPCRSSSPPSDISPPAMSIVNLLSPPSPSCPDESIIDQITLEFGEICPPLPKSKPKRSRLLKKFVPKMFLPLDTPLDLSVKTKRYDLFLSPAKWLKT